MTRQRIWSWGALCLLLAWNTPTVFGEALQCAAGVAVEDDGASLLQDDVGLATPKPDATCTAVCNSGITVSCTASSCTAVNSSCPNQAGYVTCGSQTTYCPSCPPPLGCPGGVPTCTSTRQCALSCGGPGYGTCNNGCCYCY